MDDIYGFQTAAAFSAQASISPESMAASQADLQSIVSSSVDFRERLPVFGSDPVFTGLAMADETVTPEIRGEEDEISRAMKVKIASHPRYPRLLGAYIDCQKIGAPPEVASFLDEIHRKNDASERSGSRLGADPELDEFMDTYYDVLTKYKTDLARPFDEATIFLDSVEMQLSHLCKGSSRTCPSDEIVGSSDEELSGGEQEAEVTYPRAEDHDLKDKLLRKYGGYLSSLKHEFSKKKKKGKLPKEARQTLLDWWNIHLKWPYPTEADKAALADSTGLDQKQINNWFINQRKRHWKPSEDMQFAVMEGLPAPFFVD